MSEPPRRRRRQRHPIAADATVTDIDALTSPVLDPREPAPVEEQDGERGLRGLIGGGSSQVSVGAALRARDATRPTGADLAAATQLAIIRRGWTPPVDRPAPTDPRRG